MAKFMVDTVPDSQLAKMATCVTQSVCSSQPANFSAIPAAMLAEVTLTAGDGGGDYAISNGITSGRRLTVSAQTTIPVLNTGAATHVVYDDGATLLFGTTCSAQQLNFGSTVTVPTHNFEVADPI